MEIRKNVLASFKYILIIFSFSVYSQTATLGTIDRDGNFFIADNQNKITKYSSNGDSILAYSSMFQSSISTIDSWNALRIFIFYEHLQQCLILDRFLNPLQSIRLSTDMIKYATSACLSQDGYAWFFDLTDFSIKKCDLENNRIIQRVIVENYDSEWNVEWMREYQNRLYIKNNDKVFVFDNMANLIKTIKIPTDVTLQLSEENLLYYSKGNTELFSVDIYITNEDVKKFNSSAPLNVFLKGKKNINFSIKPALIEIK